MPSSSSDAGAETAGGASVVVRRPLIDRLAGPQRVSYLAAPAGTGKSVLVRSWRDQHGLTERTGWVTVGRSEGDARHFWLTVLGAVSELLPAGTHTPTVTPAPYLGSDALMTRVLKQAELLPSPAWLVLDDLQELSSTEAVQQLGDLLGEATPQLRFVLITRRDLRLGLHRFRLDGELTELREADLRFDEADARALFEAAGVTVSSSVVKRVLERTEGWATGLRLAALLLADAPDPERLAGDFSGSERTVAEYLFAEVLDRQAPEVRDLLLRTSILEWVSGPIADHLTGSRRSQSVLVELENDGAFVIALDNDRTWFRYHRLFADLLALELRRTAADELSGLHTAAAEWLDERGFPLEAIRHAQTAEQWELAVRILGDSWYDLYYDGRAPAARELLAAFPRRMSIRDPQLATVAAADAIARGDREEAELYLSVARDRLLSVAATQRSNLEIALAGMQLALTRSRNDLPAALAQAERLLTPDEATAADNPRLAGTVRLLTLCNLGSVELWTGRFASAEEHLTRALSSAQRIGRPMLELDALTHLGLLRVLSDDWSADQAARRAVDFAEARGWADEAFVALAYCALGLSHVKQGRLTEAAGWLSRARRCLRDDSEPAAQVMIDNAEGLLELLRARPDQALDILDHGATLNGELVTAHVSIATGAAFRALALLRLGRDADMPGRLDDGDVSFRVIDAARRLRDGDSAGAADRAAMVHADPNARDTWSIAAAIVEAQAAHDMGDAGRVAHALERALARSEPSGLLAPFLLFPAGDLLERHRRLGSAHAALIDNVLALLAGRSPSPSADELPPLREPLTQSELRVLRYLATNLPGPEIASELFVTVSTVRTHMRSIYSKLDVHRRTEAVEQARQRGLLAPSPVT